MIAWILFTNPIILPANGWTLWLILPLCAAVATAYKAVRTDNLRRLPLEILSAMAYMIAGLVLLGLGLWAFLAIVL